MLKAFCLSNFRKKMKYVYELILRLLMHGSAYCMYCLWSSSIKHKALKHQNSSNTNLVRATVAPLHGSSIGSGAALRRSVTGASQSRTPVVASRRASPPAVSVSGRGPSSPRQPSTLHHDLLVSCKKGNTLKLKLCLY